MRQKVCEHSNKPILEVLEPRLLLSGTTGEQAIELFHTSAAVFIENQGQWADESVRFLHKGQGANIAHTNNGPVFELFREIAGDEAAEALRDLRPDMLHAESADMESIHFSAAFDGANTVTPVGLGQAETRFNFFVGDQTQWRQDVPSYEIVAYEGLYDGIDLHTWGRRGHLKYEFHVDPGADFSQISVSYSGIDSLEIDADGAMYVHLGGGWGEIVDDTPYIYQIIDGKQVEVAGEYRLVDRDTYTFEITDSYNPTCRLIIDPALDWSTYMGGSNKDVGFNIAVDSLDNALVTGYTHSSGWAGGGFDTSHNGNRDAFVAKLTPSGGHVWSTYMGGSNQDLGIGIAVDSLGNALVTGSTYSSGWVGGGFDTSHNGNVDAFVAKLTSSGGHIWSTYMGGNDRDRSFGIAVDSLGNALVMGYTYSSGSSGWASGGFDTLHDGEYDAFVAKLTSSGGHVWSTYMGGSSTEACLGIAVDSLGNALVTGYTHSSGWAGGGFDTSHNGNRDAFVAKLTPSGGHVWSTYMGGSDDDFCRGIAVDSLDNALVTGYTSSSGWTGGGFDTSHNGAEDAFVAKINDLAELPTIEMALYLVSDTSGTAHTSNPGTEKDAFGVGETVRITLQARNMGTVAADANWVLNVAPADDHGDVRYNSDPAPNNTNDKTVPEDGAWHYYSFDWTIAVDDPTGSYELGGSIRDANDWGTVWDTTGPGVAEADWSDAAWLTGPDITDDLAVDVTVKFQGNAGGTYPAKYAKVEVYDYNPVLSDKIAEGYTDENGRFFVDGISNVDSMPLGGARDIYVKIIAENEAARVRPNLNLTGDYYIQTEVITQPEGGLINFGTRIVTSVEGGALGFLAPARTARDWLASQSTFDASKVEVVYPTSGPSYQDAFLKAAILMDASAQEPFSDERLSEFYHEYAHAVHNEARTWLGTPGSFGAPTDFHNESDDGTAFSEGWAEFFQTAVDHGPSDDPHDPFSGYWYWEEEIELGAQWPGKNANLVDGSIACVLWDLYDAANDDGMQTPFSQIWTVLSDDDPDRMWSESDTPNDDFYHYWVSRYGETREFQEIFIDHGFAVTDDLRENNDYFGDAAELDQMGAYGGLILSDEADWFKFTTAGTMGDGSYISLVFDQPRGNLDIYLYFWNEQEGALNLVGSSVTDTDNELVDLLAGGHPAGLYYVEILGRDGDYHPDYDLVLNIIENAPPTARDDPAIVDEDSVDNVIDVLSNDDDPDVGYSLTVTEVGTASHGSTSLVGGQVLYTPAGNYYDGDSFSYTIEDNHGATGTATINITVTAVNDAPSFTKGSDQAVNEDAGLKTVAGWATGISPGPANESGQIVAFLVSNDNSGLFSQQPDISTDGTLTFTPAPDAYGTAEVAVQAIDSGGTANGGDNTSDAQTFVITVTAVNDAPSFTKGPDQAVDEDAGLQAVGGWATGISAGPPNESEQTIAFLVSNDNNSLFSQQPGISADGTLTFTPAPDAYGAAEVAIQAQDNGGTANGGDNTSDAKTFVITVAGLYDDDEYEALVSSFGLTGDALAADLNGDGRVDLVDFAMLRANFGSTLPAAPAVAMQMAGPLAAATSPVVPVVSHLQEDSSITNGDAIAAAVSAPVIDLIAELPIVDVAEPMAISTILSEPTLHRAATAEYDLRPLTDNLEMGEGDDLLADILAESAIGLPL